MLNSFIADEEESLGNRYMIIQKDAENTIGEACEEQGTFK